MKSKQTCNETPKKKWLKVAFVLYCAVMLWLLFGQRIGWYSPETYWQQLDQNVNLVPFRTITWFLSLPEITANPYLLRHGMVNLAGNVILFIPLGIFLPEIWVSMRKFWKLFLAVTGLILAVELLQLLAMLGSCDVDDLILNLLGATLGYILWKCLFSAGKREK